MAILITLIALRHYSLTTQSKKNLIWLVPNAAAAAATGEGGSSKCACACGGSGDDDNDNDEGEAEEIFLG